VIRRGEDSGIPDLWSDGFRLEAQSGFRRSGSLPSQPDPYRIINSVEEYGSTKAIFRHVAKLGIPELLFFTLSRGSSSPNWMAAMGPACVKTCASQECGAGFSLLPSPDSATRTFGFQID
jgi:hypothetical protein